MGERTGKLRKKYVDFPLDESKIFFIHDPVHNSVKCKVLGDFGFKYAKSNTTKERGNNT